MDIFDYDINWEEYPNLKDECPNCGNEENLDFSLKNAFEDYLKEDFIKYVLEAKSFEIDDYCDTCHHTYWIDGQAKKDLDKLVNNIIKDMSL